VRVAEVIEGALLLTSARARAMGVKIDIRHGDAAIVIADRIRLEQVVVNLLQNALDALAPVSAPKILIEVTRDGDMTNLVIADNGPGLSEEIVDALFTPFVTTKAQGLGLGLVISRDICAEFGGSLSLTPSTLGGAAFRVRIPRAP
jgi:two-component system C4-dicarboxylate transport sensor histidine kinase DctB